MKGYSIKAYAKINLSLDVLGKRPDGYHEVRMIMQQIDLWDRVTVGIKEEAPEIALEMDAPRITLTSDSNELPCDETNLAWKAAALILTLFPGASAGQNVSIHIEKNIPIAAGLAGGSADGAAVLHALNRLLCLGLSLKELMELGVKLGADVPFCLMGQAAAAPALGFSRADASTCAEATGIGECLSPLPPLRAWVLLSKPQATVSTAEVYGALRISEITERPDNDKIIESLHEGDPVKLYKNMYNILEKVSELRYPVIVYTKNMMALPDQNGKVMMSGSGPTIFALSPNKEELEQLWRKMKPINSETYLVETISLQ